MATFKNIRTILFEVPQWRFAQIAGTAQSTVNRWESGSTEPSLSNLNAIRGEAFRLGYKWDDKVFFVDPEVGKRMLIEMKSDMKEAESGDHPAGDCG